MHNMALTESHRATIPLKTEKIAVKVLSPRSTETTKSGLQDSVSEGLKSAKEMQKPPRTNPSTPARISSFSISSILGKPDKEYRKSTEEERAWESGKRKAGQHQSTGQQCPRRTRKRTRHGDGVAQSRPPRPASPPSIYGSRLRASRLVPT